MARQTQAERKADLALQVAFFEKIRDEKLPITKAIAEFAEKHKSKPGFQRATLEKKRSRWMRGDLQPTYKSLQGPRHGEAIHMRGWSARDFSAVFMLAGTTGHAWEKARWGKAGAGRVHCAIKQKRGAKREQETIDALVEWAEAVLRTRLESSIAAR